MTTLSASAMFEDAEHDQAVFRIQTTRCWYRVAIDGEEVTVVGPGIERRIEVPEGLTFKGQAIVAVILLEEEDS